MTRYERLQKLNADEFKRAMGVQIKTFKLMLKLLKEAQKEKMHRGGRPCLLSIEDQLIMSLKYLRDYPTFFQLGFEFGVSETSAWRACVWVEDVLIKSKAFSLPGRSKLLNSNEENILIDVTESVIERPKKRLKMAAR